MEGIDLTALSRDVLRGHPDYRDVAQEAWIMVQRQPAEDLRRPRSWLKAAILHLALRIRERDRSRRKRERIVARPDRHPSVEEEFERQDQRELLRALVEQLPQPYHEVVRLRYVEDLEIEEIATRLGRSAGTVRSQLKRGLDRLRERLGLRREPERLAAIGAWLHGARRSFGPGAPWRLERLGAGSALAFVMLITAGALAILAAGRIRSAGPAPLPPAHGGVQTAALERTSPAETASRIPLPPEARVAPESDSRSEDVWSADVEGTVLAPDGSPVAGADVLVGDEQGDDARIVATSDARGQYVVRRSDRRQLVWAEVPQRIPSARHFIASRIPGRDLDLQVGDALGSRRGRVFSRDGRPVSSAEIELIGSEFEPTGFEMGTQGTLELPPLPVRTSSTADGSFRFGVPGPAFRVLVTADGCAPLVATIRDVPPEGLDLVLPAPCLFEGRLRREGGAVASGVTLELLLPRPLPPRVTATDEGGAFRFAGLPPGPYVLRSLTDPSGSLASCRLEGTLAEGERARRDMSLDEGATIRGHALLSGRPATGWIVELEQKHACGSAPDLRRTSADSQGAFAFPSCSSSSGHVLRLLSPGDQALQAWALHVRAGAEVVLRADESGQTLGSLRGRFEADDPALLPAVAVLWGPTHSAPLLVNVDPRTGEFSVDRVCPEEHKVKAWVPRVGSWMAGRVEVEAGRRAEVVFHLPVPGRLALAVELSEGTSWQDLDVELRADALYDQAAKVGHRRFQELPEQNLLVADLFPGEHSFTVKLAGVRLESRTTSVRSGETTLETLHVGKVVPVTLRLLLDRKLEAGERMSLTIQETDRQRTVELARAARNGTEETFLIGLSPDTRELHVRSTLGREGTLVVAPGEIAPGGTLAVRATSHGASRAER